MNHSIVNEDSSGNVYLRNPFFKIGDEVRIKHFFDNILEIFTNETPEKEITESNANHRKYNENILNSIKNQTVFIIKNILEYDGIDIAYTIEMNGEDIKVYEKDLQSKHMNISDVKKGQKIWICSTELKKEYKQNPDEPYEKILYDKSGIKCGLKYNIKPKIKKEYDKSIIRAYDDAYDYNNYDLAIAHSDKYDNKYDWGEAIIESVMTKNNFPFEQISLVNLESLYDDLSEKTIDYLFRRICDIYYKNENKFIRIIDHSKQYC